MKNKQYKNNKKFKLNSSFKTYYQQNLDDETKTENMS